VTPKPIQGVLVTGAAGFVGRHLIQYLATLPEPPERVVAVDVRGSQVPRQGVTVVEADLADPVRTAAIVRDAAPEVILHLAAVTHGDDPDAYFACNVLACRNLLAAAERCGTPRVLVVGSAAQYGVTTGGHEVVDESRPLRSTTLYGATKTIQETWALAWAEAGRGPVVCVRPFNLIGPGQPATLVPMAFLAQVADVLDGKADEVCVGNTETRRDYTDVRDVVRAMWALLVAEDTGGKVFNIASGEPVRTGDMVEACLRLSGQEIPVRQDPSRLRTHDVPTIVGDARRLREATGWRPQIPWHTSLEDMWRAMGRAR